MTRRQLARRADRKLQIFHYATRSTLGADAFTQPLGNGRDFEDLMAALLGDGIGTGPCRLERLGSYQVLFEVAVRIAKLDAEVPGSSHRYLLRPQ